MTEERASERPAGPVASWIGYARSNPALIPGIAAIAIMLFWTGAQGGRSLTDSGPTSLLLLGILLVTGVVFRDELVRLPRPARWAIGLFAAFTLWNFISIGWADDQGIAWDSSNRCLLFLIAFSLFTILPWRSGGAALLLGVYAVGIALIGVVVLLKSASSVDPLFNYFVADRYAEPTGYYNANAALYASSMFIAIFLAARRETPWPLRGVTLAAAGVLFQLSLLPQSRGWLIVLPIALVAYLIIVPGLVRSLITMLPVAIVAAVTAPTMLDVYDTVNAQGSVGPPLDDARTAVLVSAALLFAVGAAIGFIDRRMELPARTAQVGTRIVVGVAAAGALIGVIVAIAAIGNPVTWAGDRWDEFKGGEIEHTANQGSRLGLGLGSNRYDFWRVAVDEFEGSPVYGVGSDNFPADYIQHRRSDEEPAYPHSLPLRILGGTGLIGALLFTGFLVSALIGVGRVRLRASDPLARGVAGIVAVVFIYWFAHSSGDWFWSFPALTGPVLAFLGMGMRLDAAPSADSERRWQRAWSVPAIASASIVAVVAVISVSLPWISQLDVDKASEIWRGHPAEAFDRLDEASDLNFLSSQPDLVAGEIASQLGDHARMRVYFEQALERDPRNWYAVLELAALDAIEGNQALALQRLDRVSQLNPREQTTELVRAGVISGNPLSLRALSNTYLDRYCERLGRKRVGSSCGSATP